MKKKITVNNDWQKYTYYLTEPEGKKFDPEFNPELTPKQMMELGVFGGMYFYGCDDDIPKGWLKKAKISHDGTKRKELNFFGIIASQPLKYWQDKGWIYKDDPRGWFQWYVRYYRGRRIPSEDARQIKRWKAITRHISQIKKHCPKGYLGCRRKQRQAVLHWAYDSRKI